MSADKKPPRKPKKTKVPKQIPEQPFTDEEAQDIVTGPVVEFCRARRFMRGDRLS